MLGMRALAFICAGLALAGCKKHPKDEDSPPPSGSAHTSGRAKLKGVSTDHATDLVIAYEPVWAIGTGEVCAAEEANRVCGVIRDAVGRLFGADAAKAVRILYGGSVKPDNAAELFAMSHIDGGLVGGASLKAAEFAAIVAAAQTTP